MHVLRSRQNKPKYGTKDGLHRITQYPAELAGWIYKYIFWIHAETKVGGLPPIADEYIQLRRGGERFAAYMCIASVADIPTYLH